MKLAALAAVLLAGCTTQPTPPPLPPVAKVVPAASVVTAQPVPVVLVLSANFAPGMASTAFFAQSTDLTNWTVFYSQPYPVEGGTLVATNVSKIGMFFRAGYSL